MSQSSVVDLSHPLAAGMTIYPGDPPFSSSPHSNLEKDGYSVHSLSLGSHSGTHIDAPCHFIPNGTTVDQIPLSTLMGPALVIRMADLPARYRITWDDIRSYVPQMHPGVLLLVHTGYDRHWLTPEYFAHPFLDRHAARKILETGIRVIGIDTLSPDETHLESIDGADFGVHESVLGAGGVLAENLTNLDKLDDSSSWVVSLFPLRIGKCDGSPVRAVAWKADENHSKPWHPRLA